MSITSQGSKMCAELQAEIVAAAATLAKNKQTRKEKSALAGFEAAMKERKEASGSGRDAISYFNCTDHVEYHGGACPDSSDGEDEGDGASGAEDGEGCVASYGGSTRAANFVGSSNEDRNDEKGSSLGSFIDDGDTDGIDENFSD